MFVVHEVAQKLPVALAVTRPTLCDSQLNVRAYGLKTPLIRFFLMVIVSYFFLYYIIVITSYYFCITSNRRRQKSQIHGMVIVVS